jgi:biopolymer transport protein ExbB
MISSPRASAQEGEPAPAVAPAAAPAAAPAGEQPAAHSPPKSKLWWFIETSGLIGAVILVLSIYFIATVSRLFVEMRMSEEMPAEIVSEANVLLEKKDYQGLYNMVSQDHSMFSRILTAGLTELVGGLSEARDAMERTADSITVEMEKKISMLAVLGTLGPMIGLLGTLKGMIASFSVIALSDTQLKASEVAGGISEALLLTFEGVALSVPAIYFFAIFRNRVASISSTTLLAADEFMRRLSNASKNKPAAGAAAAAPSVRTARPT